MHECVFIYLFLFLPWGWPTSSPLLQAVGHFYRELSLTDWDLWVVDITNESHIFLSPLFSFRLIILSSGFFFCSTLVQILMGFSFPPRNLGRRFSLRAERGLLWKHTRITDDNLDSFKGIWKRMELQTHCVCWLIVASATFISSVLVFRHFPVHRITQILTWKITH